MNSNLNLSRSASHSRPITPTKAGTKIPFLDQSLKSISKIKADQRTPTHMEELLPQVK